MRCPGPHSPSSPLFCFSVPWPCCATCDPVDWAGGLEGRGGIKGEAGYGTIATDRLFTGQRREAALGLYDYKARFYDPELGRLFVYNTR